MRFAALIGALILSGCMSPAAQAAQSTSLQVRLDPEQLGGSTTIAFGFNVKPSGHTLPPALTHVDVRLPLGMGVNTEGLASCTRAALLAHGRGGCAPNSQVGFGNVYIKVPLGNVVRSERAALALFNGPRRDGHTTLLFYAAGRLPIAARLVFPGVLIPGSSTLGQTIETTIPLIPTLPDAPDAALLSLSSTIGPRDLTYYRSIGHRRVRFYPQGVTVPLLCPPGGFQFIAAFRFNDASTSQAVSTVACPR